MCGVELSSSAHGSLVFPAPLGDYPFLIAWSRLPCQRSMNCIGLVYFWALHPVPLTSMPVLVPVLSCFNYCSFAVCFELRTRDASICVLFSRD